MKEEVNIYRTQVVGYQALCFGLMLLSVVLATALFFKSAEAQACTNMKDLLLDIQKEQIEQLPNVPSIQQEEIKEIGKDEAYFTNYYIGDGSSTQRTGSGLTVSDFQINDLGMFTYGGRVVIATATKECLKSNSKGCNKYSQSADGIHYYSYYDEMDIEILGETYPAIVLDSCGACMTVQPSDEGLQRYDIFMDENAKHFGKAKGYTLDSGV